MHTYIHTTADEDEGECRKMHSEEFYNLDSSVNQDALDKWGKKHDFGD
jgi:hypothetical protein